MSLRTELLTQLTRFDDEAWIALANRGLLRRARKDLQDTTPAVTSETSEEVVVSVDPYLVRFDTRGPAGAECDCPSGTICQHILTASLWLLTTANPADTTPDATEPEIAAPGGELLGVGVEEMVQHAGRAGYRWALRYVDDLELETDVRVAEERLVLISLASPRVTFRFMGGGVAGLVADAKLASMEKYQVAAAIAYQRMSGVGPPAEETTKADNGPPTRLADSRRRLRNSAGNLLTDTVRLGVSHLSRSVHERYETLAVWAQGAEYHRLALLLRRLADHVELLLDRSARADEHRLLEEASIAYALVTALEASEQPRLVGQARNKYDVVRRLDVIGLGAFPWRTGSGYRGLTALFWWPEENRFLSWTDARPELMRSFDPRQRYTAPAPWTGLSSPAEATGSRLILNDARLSPSGRLSGAERTRAAAEPITGTAIAAALPAVSHWSELDARPPRSLLDTPDPLADWAVLRPTGFGHPAFHPVRQTLEWDLNDDTGAVLKLELPYTVENQHAIDRIEALQEIPVGSLLVARVRRTPSGLVGEPLSLVRPHDADEPAVDPLHFGAQAKRVNREAPTQSQEPDAYLPPQLEDLRSWLTTQAERGTGAATPGALTAKLASRHQALRAIGLTNFPASPDPDPAVGILRSNYLLLQTVQLLTGHSG